MDYNALKMQDIAEQDQQIAICRDWIRDQWRHPQSKKAMDDVYDAINETDIERMRNMTDEALAVVCRLAMIGFHAGLHAIEAMEDGNA